MTVENLVIQLFGNPQIVLNGKPIKVDTKKAIALIAYLAAERGIVSRETLATLFWGESDDKHARSSLRRTLSSARKSLDKSWLVVDGENISIKQADGLFIDIIAFEKHVEQASIHHEADDGLCLDCVGILQNAVDLYQDDFMVGFTLKDSPAFDEWQRLESERLRYELENILDQLLQWHIEHEKYDQGIKLAQRWNQLNPFEDKIVCQLMQLYVYSNQRNAALKAYQDFEARLLTELDLPPLEETQALYEKIQQNQVTIPLLPLKSMPVVPISNLPAQTKPFVGREAEQAHLSNLLKDASCHLLTLVGLGGMGKTRLAIETARQHVGNFRNGVHYVVLHSETSEAQLIASIASVLKYYFYNGTPAKDQILDYLRDKEVLLLIDNFEYFADNYDFINEIIYGAPKVKLMIVTQRQLELEEEWLFQLKGLPFPNVVPEDVVAYSSVELFVTCVKRLFWDYAVDRHLREIATLCALFEGMPLAIELAACQLGDHSCDELIAEVSSSLDSLQSVYKNTAERHRSLRAIFDYSWRQLDDKQQSLLLSLIVFQGGFTVETLTEITGASVEIFESLTRQALINEIDEGRFDIPNVLRTFLAEKEFPNKKHIEQAHSAYFADFICVLDLERTHGLDALNRLERELGNVRAGWDLAVRRQDLDLVIIYIDNLFLYYEIRGRYEEGKVCFEESIGVFRALKSMQEVAVGLLGKALARLGAFCWHLGEIDAAIPYYEEALALQERVNDSQEMAWTLNNMGIVALSRSQQELAEDYLTQSLEMAKSIQHELQMARSLANLGILDKSRQRFDEALEKLMECQRIYEEQDHQRLIASTYTNLGNVFLGIDDLEKAETYYQLGYDQKKAIGDQWGVACVLLNWGRVALFKDMVSDAEKILWECLAICQNLGKRTGIARSTFYLGKVDEKLGDMISAQKRLVSSLQLEKQLGNVSRFLGILQDIAVIKIELGEMEAAYQILSAIAKDERCPTGLATDVAEKLKIVEEISTTQQPQTEDVCDMLFEWLHEQNKLELVS